MNILYKDFLFCRVWSEKWGENWESWCWASASKPNGCLLVIVKVKELEFLGHSDSVRRQIWNDDASLLSLSSKSPWACRTLAWLGLGKLAPSGEGMFWRKGVFEVEVDFSWWVQSIVWPRFCVIGNLFSMSCESGENEVSFSSVCFYTSYIQYFHLFTSLHVHPNSIWSQSDHPLPLS